MRKIKFTDEQIQYIIKQYTQHIETTKELGEKFYCSKAAIERVLKENGIVLEQWYHYKNLTGEIFEDLTVLGVNQERYEMEKQRTNKPHRYWFCHCKCGNIVEVESSHLKNGHTTSCGCNRSNGERKIAKLLKENDIDFIKEYSFNDLRGVGNGLLRYDFAIFNKNKLQYLIEFNGSQHYRMRGGWDTLEKFEVRQANDLLKIEYCKKKDIPLIIIPYTHYKKLNFNDLLLETTSFLQKGESI